MLPIALLLTFEERRPPPGRFDPAPDWWLVRRARGGDRDAFGRLYDRHAPRVYRLLRRLTGGRTETAEDLTQETFVTAYGALADWRGVGAFPTWLCGIAVRRYAAAVRHDRRRPDTQPLNEDINAADDAPGGGDPLARLARREAEAALEAAIAGLPEACREAFVLVRVEGMRYQEAADALGVPLGTLQSRLNRATRLLYERLSHLIYGADPPPSASAAAPVVPKPPASPPPSVKTGADPKGAVHAAR